MFPETFSFHPDAHHPTELRLQLEDLWSDPHRLGPQVARRDAEELLRVLVAAVPAYLERTLDRLERDGLGAPVRPALHADALLLCWVLTDFALEKRFDGHGDVRMAVLHLAKLEWKLSTGLLRALTQVGADATQPPAAGRLRERVRLAELARLHAAIDRGARDLAGPIARVAEACLYRWLEDVCLDETNLAFEGEGSPFRDRESEVLAAVRARAAGAIRRGRDFSPFLGRCGDRDCLRLLEKLEIWFLRRYDVYHAAAAIHHRENLRRARLVPERVLSHHATRNYLLAIGAAIAPFLVAAFAYRHVPFAIDLVCSAEVVVVNSAAVWFLLVRFCWKKDLTLFHASVPRIGAGIIVGYLPVFLIDEVWDLASRPIFPLGVIVSFLGFTTLLYLFVEVQRRIGDPSEAFSRATRIFLLGLFQSMMMGLIVTSLLGGFMVDRTWGEQAGMSIAALREALPPVVGQLPPILGLEPIVAFPSAVFLMTFLSFFIGTFLQLLWEDLPITEPLGTRPSGVSGIQTGTFRASGGPR